MSIPPPGPLSYTGVVAIPFITRTFAPTTSDFQFTVPTFWIDTSDSAAYLLLSKPGSVADWALISNTGGTVTDIDTPDGNTVTPASGIVTFAEGTGVNITGSGSTVTFNSIGGGFTWNDVTTTSATMVSGNAYVADNAALVTLTLPSTASFGDTFLVSGLGAGGWQIAQNASQYLILGSSTSTVGVGGYIASTLASNSAYIVCVVEDVGFKILTCAGNLTVV